MSYTGNATEPHLNLEVHKGQYKYPATKSLQSDATWLVDPMAWIESNIKSARSVTSKVSVGKEPQWQIEAFEKICAENNLDKNYWLPKIESGQSISYGEIFGLLNKLLK